MDVHYLGTFETIDQLYDLYPSGGSYGDYVILEGALVYWNDYQRVWGEKREFEPEMGVETQTVEGNLEVGHDLRVGGKISSKEGIFDAIKVGSIDLRNNPFALSSHKHGEYAEKRHKHLLQDIKDLAEVIGSGGGGGGGGLSILQMWLELGKEGENQINISHLRDLIDALRGTYLSRKSDDYAEGNITFRKGIEVVGRAIFHGGGIFISNGVPEEIFNAVTEPEVTSLEDLILEESEDEGVVASGYVEHFK